ncbi:relaxase/mobilization nuclease domain-containing protein [Amycolatopsis anabasis]|uniref:relaxase/mobilization nuclease domain-containing protein n=1 Tax=Amycolatopsis anabasis TaxID=1840409 RepID=UPI00131EA478|nr:hypothetical protein [Amycolatopsis anabasis]
MIAKAIDGWRPGGLLAYLMGPGTHEEHRNPRIVASFDGAPGLHQPPKCGPGEFDFDLRALIGVMSELPKEFGLPLDNPAPTPDGLTDAAEWMDWLRIAGKRRPPAHAPDWVKLYRYDPKLDQVVLRPGYVWHCPVRLHPDDPVLSDEQWERIAQRLMEATGIHQSGCRWVAVRHGDDHIHLMATLVTDQGGQLHRFHPSFYRMRLREACRALERELGLTPTPDVDWTASRQPTRNEVGKASRLGRAEPARAQLHRLVAQAAATAAGPDEFLARLDELQVQYQLTRGASGEIRGWRCAMADDTTAAGEPVWFGGGRLAADLTWPKLQERWASTPSAQPVERTDDGRRSTAAARLEVLEEAAVVVDEAAERVRTGKEDPDGIAHAAGELLGTLALGKEYRTHGPLTAAMDRYDRAMRSPVRAQPRNPGALARELRRASRRIALVGSLSGRGHEKFALAALVLALAGLIAAIRDWQLAKARPHQAAAAERAISALPIDREAAARGAARVAAAAAKRATASPDYQQQPARPTPVTDQRRPAASRPPR